MGFISPVSSQSLTCCFCFPVISAFTHIKHQLRSHLFHNNTKLSSPESSSLVNFVSVDAPHTLFLQTMCLVCTVSPTATLPMRPRPSEINPAPSPSQHPSIHPSKPTFHVVRLWEEFRTFFPFSFCYVM